MTFKVQKAQPFFNFTINHNDGVSFPFHFFLPSSIIHTWKERQCEMHFWSGIIFPSRMSQDLDLNIGSILHCIFLGIAGDGNKHNAFYISIFSCEIFFVIHPFSREISCCRINSPFRNIFFVPMELSTSLFFSRNFKIIPSITLTAIQPLHWNVR